MRSFNQLHVLPEKLPREPEPATADDSGGTKGRVAACEEPFFGKKSAARVGIWLIISGGREWMVAIAERVGSSGSWGGEAAVSGPTSLGPAELLSNIPYKIESCPSAIFW